jgi:hypothetical protein
MRYPIAIETGDAEHAYGVVVPDLPGCFSAGDTLDEALANSRRPSCFMWKVYSMTANPFRGRPLSNSCAASAAIAAGPGRSSTSKPRDKTVIRSLIGPKAVLEHIGILPRKQTLAACAKLNVPRALGSYAHAKGILI